VNKYLKLNPCWEIAFKIFKGQMPEKSINDTVWHRILANSDGFETHRYGESFNLTLKRFPC
jgi:hypothetical protein